MAENFEPVGGLTPKTTTEPGGTSVTVAAVYRCNQCFALVDGDSLPAHEEWHAKSVMRTALPAHEEWNAKSVMRTALGFGI